ncbi:P-loop containing nucleoside triphosphate hydrolase protein [Sphaerosporella brunnea]|uniref:P-loop containing nucleoside triphosphate hydrolase protein n=1 Tax=Sphaerosporella brunnea TaxID=1250544 RepID=A0A5J5FAP4_9PEZI|nr:P-loop containing nucleoside triphosphate hydrolase protein [Sphaerosporella brunnea]
MDARKPPRRLNTTRAGNQDHSHSEGATTTTTTTKTITTPSDDVIKNLNSARESSRGPQQRLKPSKVRRGTPKRPELPAHQIPRMLQQQPQEHQPSEKFSTRRGKHGGGAAQKWISEQDQVAQLGQQLQKLGAREGIGADFEGYVKKNPLIAQYENETTSHFAEEWRKIPETPTPAELLRQDVDVPTNIVDGPFPSVDDYLSTHYELVREDVLSGLRMAIRHIRTHPNSDDTREIAIYENVEILGLTFAYSQGVCVKVSFSLNRAGKHVRWQQSKRLIPGTLVCISQDEFQTFKVATVVARPLSGLEMNPPEVDLMFQVDELELDPSKPFLMVETRQGYFEAFRWVLKAMQRMTEENMPLKEHIVYLDPDVGPPQYLEENPVYNLTSIYPDASEQEKESVEEVNILQTWPRGIKNSMDRSQTDALKTILTKRVAVIQGPPGTGKTYTSVMALHALLQNMAEDDPPVIVACQTNHALDQLLRHVYKFEHSIIRLGGRTQDRDEIKKRTMYEVRRGSKVRIQGRSPHGIMKQMDLLRNEMCQLLSPLTHDLIPPQALFEHKLINQKQMESFEKGSSDWVQAQDDSKPNTPIATWLQDSVAPVIKYPDYYTGQEDPEIDYEALLDLEAEFLGNGGGDDDDIKDELSGIWLPFKHSWSVECPEGISQQEIDRALRKNNLWDLPDHMRAALYHYWEEKILQKIMAKLIPLRKAFHALSTELRITRMEKDSFLMSQAKLIGMTTTGLAKYRTLVASCKPRVILIEEAAEVLEAPVLVGCLPSVEHMILVGDHKQLKGKCNETALMGHPYYLDTSLFERWVDNEMPYITLRVQRRMRPEIRAILEPIYPNGLLRDHQSVLGRDPVQGMGNFNLFWWTHDNPEERMEDTPSKCNPSEANMICRFVEYLILNGVTPDQITILTFYTGQRSLLFKTLRQNTQLKGLIFKIVTVDSYQGEENDIIILSLVRSNDEKNIGFLSNENRVCVSLSRAQRGLYIFGNAIMLTAVDKLWWDVVDKFATPGGEPRIGTCIPLTCHKHKMRTLVQSQHEWDDINGGCKKPCAELMNCGHVCPLQCHPFAHDNYRCCQPCKKPKLACGHQCEKKCWEDCICGVCPQVIPRSSLRQQEDWGCDPMYNEDLVEEEQDLLLDLDEEPQQQKLGFGGIPRPDGVVRSGHGRFKAEK